MIIVFILEKYWKVSTIEIFPVNHETKLRNVSKFIWNNSSESQINFG